MIDQYESPLSARYASEEMVRLFSSDNRYQTWRKLWVELAKAEKELGLPITAGQIAEMESHIRDIDYDIVRSREKEVKHDVMAHIYAFGKAAPSASGIIHLGATSCYVTDNTDLILYRQALLFIRAQICSLLSSLAEFAGRYSGLPTVGYIHYQPAQLVTVGKRATLWMQDLLLDLRTLDSVLGEILFLGCRGATGTEASFMELFEGDSEKVDALNGMLASSFSFPGIFPVCGQTYPRKVDSLILNALSGVAQSCSRFATDIRLLQHDHQIEEPFGSLQVGSSAMAYKQNPVRCERICSLSRYLMVTSMNGALTASSQWFERTLDDSANRRIALPEAFLCADAILRLAVNVTQGLRVNEPVIRKAVDRQVFFAATENLLMKSVKKGGDRQQLHEAIRGITVQIEEEIKSGGDPDPCAVLIASGCLPLSEEEIRESMDAARYTGRCEEQVKTFLRTVLPLFSQEKKEFSPIEI